MIRRRQQAFTLVEAIVVMALITLMATVFYPVLARAMRTTFQVTSRAELQSGMRLAMERMIRDTHQAHVILDVTAGESPSLVLFRLQQDAVRKPETVVDSNRVAADGLPRFPFAGDSTSQPLAGDRAIVLPGQRISYVHSGERAEIVRRLESGRLRGTVLRDEETGRSTVASYDFLSDGPALESIVGANISTFVAIPVAYRPDGFMVRAASPPTAASALAIRITASVAPEGDKPDMKVVEEMVTKIWLERRLSEATFPGGSNTFGDDVDY